MEDVRTLQGLLIGMQAVFGATDITPSIHPLNSAFQSQLSQHGFNARVLPSILCTFGPLKTNRVFLQPSQNQRAKLLKVRDNPKTFMTKRFEFRWGTKQGARVNLNE